MTFDSDFDRQLTQMLTEIESECMRLEQRVHAANDEWEAMLEQREHVFRTRELHRQRNRVAPTLNEQLRQRLNGKTTREMVMDLVGMRDSKESPTFRVVDINNLLVEAGMFVNKQKAAESVYSMLGRNPNTFIKVDKGRYLLKSDGARNGRQDSPAPTDKRSHRGTGVMEKVGEIVRQHPQWDRDQIVAAMIKDGWDFQGKNPDYTVRMYFTRKNRKVEGNRQRELRSVS